VDKIFLWIFYHLASFFFSEILTMEAVFVPSVQLLKQQKFVFLYSEVLALVLFTVLFDGMSNIRGTVCCLYDKAQNMISS
jgi:hypothetical protein